MYPSLSKLASYHGILIHAGSASSLGSGSSASSSSGSGSSLCMNSTVHYQPVITLFENVAPPLAIVTLTPIFGIGSTHKVNGSGDLQLYIVNITDNVTIYSNTSFNYSSGALLNITYTEQIEIDGTPCINTVFITIKVLEDVAPNCTTLYMLPCSIYDTVVDFQCNSTDHPQLGNVTYSTTGPHYAIDEINNDCIVVVQPILPGNHTISLTACSGGVIPNCARYNISFTLPELLYFPNNTHHIPVDTILQENVLVPNGTLVCSEYSSCNDSMGESIQYSASTDNGPFDVFENGSIYVTNRIDYTSENLYNLSVTCNNSLSQDSVVVSISNRKFEFSNATYFVVVPENVSSGEVFLNVTLKWHPASTTVTYSISDSLFNIDSTGGISVSSMQSLDFETANHFTIVVNATALYAKATATVTINVTDVNDNQPFFDTRLLEKNISITESLGSVVLNISADDNDTGINQKLTYTIDHNEVVDIHSNNGSVYINTSSLECYAGMTYVLSVITTDSGDPALSSTINITIRIESFAIVFDSSLFMFNITENTPIATIVGYLNASLYTAAGVDIGGRLLSYSISSEYFYIDSVNAVLYVSSTVDRESISHYDFNVTASLQCPNKVTMNESSVSIFVTDQNDNRPAFDMSFTNLTIDQDVAPESILYSALAVDNNDSGRNSQISKYSISRSFNDLFYIDSVSGSISISEVPTEYRDYLFDVFAEDGGTPSLTSHPLSLLVSGLIRSQAQNVHFEKDLYIFSVTENTSINSFIGKIKLVYNRNPGPVILTCFNCENFIINSTTMEIYTEDILDREQQSSYTFSVTASVGDFQIAQTTVSIIVTDINDNMPMFSHNTYTRAIGSNATIGTSILTVTATDSDINENGDISYSLHPNNTGFGINTNGSIVTRYTELESGSYNLYIVATDNGINQQLSSSTQVRVTVFNQTKSFPFNSSSYYFSVEENSTIGSIIGSMFTSPNFTYRLVHNSSDSSYCFTLTNGTISITCEIDRETTDLYYFQIEASSSNVTSMANVIITITDLNDNPPVFEYSTYTTAISRSLPPSTIIATFKASDVDLNSTIRYYHNGPETYFKINQSTGEMTFNEINIGGLMGSYSSSVVASDGTLNTTVNYTIFIPYFNEELLQFDQSLYVFNLTENSDILTKLGTLVLRYRNGPINESNVLSFEITDHDVITNRSSDLDFYINQVGELLTLVKTDREVRDFYNFTVTGYYGNTFKLIAKTSVLITIQDINDVTPQFNQTIYFSEVDSTVQNGDALLRVTASDNDYQENGTILYTISDTIYLPSNRADVNDNLTTIFAINETSGVITLQSFYHSTGQYRLTVAASDNSTVPLTSTALVLINIFDPIPANISFTEQNYNFSVAENVSLLTPIGTISVREMSSPGLQGIHYSIAGGNGSDVFFIDPFSGTVFNTVLLDRETHLSYTLSVAATALGVPSIEPSVTDVFIIVEDINDEIPLFSQQVYNVSRSSTESNSTVVTATATDRDIGDNARLTYTIISDRNNNFTIDNVTGVVYANNSEIPAGVYPLRISVADHGLLPHTSTALVLVTIYHIPPDTISFSHSQYVFNITENSHLLTKVGDVSIQEMDNPSIKGIKYVITDGNGSEAFAVSSTGAISNIIIPDRETAASYTLTIEATVIDMPDISPVHTDIIINVMDVNDEVPAFNQSIYRVNFNTNVTALSNIIMVLAYDEDIGSNARITYRISNSGQPFQINSSTGEIRNTASLILESSYILHVEANDQGTPSNTATTIVLLSITLPTITRLDFPLTLYTFTVSENANLGTSLGFVTLNPHHGFIIENAVYSINSTVFAVDGNNGEIYTRQKLDRETFTQYTINMTAVLQVDNTHLIASTLVMVNVMDENDNAPVFSNLPNTIAVSEGLHNGTRVFEVEASDADIGHFSTLTFSVTDEHFGITPAGIVFVKGDIDRETEDQYTLLIEAEDGGGLTVYAFLTINILDINDNHPVLLTGNGECFVHERAENSTACTLIFTDHDLAENGSVRVTNVSGGGFHYSTADNDVHDNIITLLVVSPLDYETNSRINITVQFQDEGVIPNVNDKSLIIQVIDEPDNVPIFVNGNNQQFEVRTIVTNGSRIFTVLATDEDNDEIEYAIVKANPVNVFERFYITPSTGAVLIVALDPPFTPNSTVTLTISATDNSVYALSNHSNVSISIIPNTLSFAEVTYEFSLVEEMRINTLVGTIQIDRDSQATDIELSIDPSDVPFEIRPNSDGNNRILTGTIQTTEQIDRDNDGRNQYIFSVIAERHAVSETATATVTVNIEDINDNSPMYTGDGQLSIKENASRSTEIATISAIDIDLGENGTIRRYRLLNNNENFIINNQGVLRSNVVFDYETSQTYGITVEISDGGQPSRKMSYDFTVEVININDNLPVFNHTFYFADIKEGETVGHTLVNVIVEDKDLEPFSIRGSPLVNALGNAPLRLIVDERSRDGSSYPIILSSISPAPQSALYQFDLQASDGDYVATSTLYVGVFTQIHFFQFDLDDIPEIDTIAGRIIILIRSSLVTVYGSSGTALNVYLYSTERTGNGKATL